MRLTTTVGTFATSRMKGRFWDRRDASLKTANGRKVDIPSPDEIVCHAPETLTGLPAIRAKARCAKMNPLG
jgi:hypothetical protein